MGCVAAIVVVLVALAGVHGHGFSSDIVSPVPVDSSAPTTAASSTSLAKRLQVALYQGLTPRTRVPPNPLDAASGTAIICATAYDDSSPGCTGKHENPECIENIVDTCTKDQNAELYVKYACSGSTETYQFYTKVGVNAMYAATSASLIGWWCCQGQLYGRNDLARSGCGNADHSIIGSTRISNAQPECGGGALYSSSSF